MMQTIELIMNYYSSPSNRPLTLAEIAHLFGTGWMNKKPEWEAFRKAFVHCGDGLVRPR